MEFRILGPLEVVDRGTTIRVQAAKQRALLGVLLLHPNEVVSSERLIDELWGELPPATAAKTLQTYVSQLRRLLGPDAITTRLPGYLLRVEADAVDAARFRRLTAEARDLLAEGELERANALYLEALALWRGPPLADVVFESFARNEVERLEEERLAALTERIDCELALGRHEDLVAELKALVEQYPLRERLRAQLMLALYRSARQADALAAYQDARRTFVDQLGLEPSRELQDLERAILTHDAALEPPSPPARERPQRLQRRPRRALAVGMLGLVAAALAFVAFALGDEPAAPTLLAPDSVGFVDAKSGRITHTFPVGYEPVALAVVDNAVWAANFQDATLTRVYGKRARSRAIRVGGRPIAMTLYGGTLWVLTTNGLLVPIARELVPGTDPVGDPVRIGTPRVGTMGSLTAVDGSLWATNAAPPVMHRATRTRIRRILAPPFGVGSIIRVNLSDLERPIVIRPDYGVDGPVTHRDGEVWVAGSGYVFPIWAASGIPGLAPRVGFVLDMAVSADSLWVLSGGSRVPAYVVRGPESPVPALTKAGRRMWSALPIGQIQLRRVDLNSRSAHDPIDVGESPIAVAVAAGSIWVASYDREGGMLYRVDPADEEVVDTIPLGARPTALAADRGGIWVAVADCCTELARPSN